MIWGPLVAAMLIGCSSHPAAEPQRCTLRIAAKGIFVDGGAMSLDHAIARCKRTTGAVVVIGDDAPAGVWPDVRRRLDKERIQFFVRGVVDDRTCLDNPLAKGCD